MQKLMVAFCDDDSAFRAALRARAEACFRAHGVAAEAVDFPSGAELAAALEHMSFQLIFLDIDMPGLDGIGLGALLRARGCGADIIYVSNMEEKVYEVFSIHPWSFIRKSRLSEELDAVLAEYIRFIQSRIDRLVLQNTEGKLSTFGPEDILYVEAAGKTQKLFTAQGGEPFLVRCSLRDIEQQLLPLGFIRIHKGFLVNFRFIRKITSRSVLLDSGTELPVGRDRLKPAKEQYLSLMKWRGLSRGPAPNAGRP